MREPYTPLANLCLENVTHEKLVRWMADAQSVEAIAGQPRCALEGAGFSDPQIQEINEALQRESFAGITGM